MGDRGNIVIKYDEGSKIYLYSHWTGAELPEILADALDSDAGRGRWGDDSYLTRIIFDKMTEFASDPETGFGISPYLTDNEHAILQVTPDAQTVERIPYGSEAADSEWSFEEFIALVRAGKYEEEVSPY